MLDPFSDKYGARMTGDICIVAVTAEILFSGAILTALGNTGIRITYSIYDKAYKSKTCNFTE